MSLLSPRVVRRSLLFFRFSWLSTRRWFWHTTKRARKSGTVRHIQQRASQFQQRLRSNERGRWSVAVLCGGIAILLAILLLFSTTSDDEVQAGLQDEGSRQHSPAVPLAMQPRKEPTGLPEQSEPEPIEVNIVLKPTPDPEPAPVLEPFPEFPGDIQPLEEPASQKPVEEFNPFDAIASEPAAQPTIVPIASEVQPNAPDIELAVLPLEPRFDSIPLSDAADVAVASSEPEDDSITLAAIEEGWGAGADFAVEPPAVRGVELAAAEIIESEKTITVDGKATPLFQQIAVTMDKQAPESASIGDWSPFLLNVSNRSESIVPQVHVTETLPVGTRVELDPSVTGAEIVGNRIHWRIADLQPNESRSLRVLAKAAEPGEFVSETKMNAIVLVSGETTVESEPEAAPVKPTPNPPKPQQIMHESHHWQPYILAKRRARYKFASGPKSFDSTP